MTSSRAFGQLSVVGEITLSHLQLLNDGSELIAQTFKLEAMVPHLDKQLQRQVVVRQVDLDFLARGVLVGRGGVWEAIEWAVLALGSNGASFYM